MADRELLIAVVFAAVGFLFVFASMGLLGRIIRGKAASYPEKLATYECGELPIGDAWIRYNPRFLLLAIVFVIFGVEVAFLFPWAVVYKETGIQAFFSMLVFLVILLVGYLWFWKLGELRWVLPQEAGVLSHESTLQPVTPGASTVGASRVTSSTETSS